MSVFLFGQCKTKELPLRLLEWDSVIADFAKSHRAVSIEARYSDVAELANSRLGRYPELIARNPGLLLGQQSHVLDENTRNDYENKGPSFFYIGEAYVNRPHVLLANNATFVSL